MVTTRPPVATYPAPSRAVAAWKQSSSPSSAADEGSAPPRRAAGDRLLGVTLGGDDDPDRGARPHADRLGHGGPIPGGSSAQRGGQIAVEQGQQHLRLGVAEARIELQHGRAGVGEHQAGVEHAPVGVAVASLQPGNRLEDAGDRLVECVGTEPRHRRIGAHPTGVRPGIAIAQALVVAGRANGNHLGAAHQGKDGDLAPGEPLFQDQLRTGPRAVQQVVDRGLGRGKVFGDHHALAGREPVRLHDQATPLRVERPRMLQRLGHRGAGAPRGGDHAGAAHLLLGVGLGRLEARRPACGAEDRDGCLAPAHHSLRLPGVPPDRSPPGRTARATRAGRRRPDRTGPGPEPSPPPLPCRRCPGRRGPCPTSGSRARRQARACSRPPPPRTRISRPRIAATGTLTARPRLRATRWAKGPACLPAGPAPAGPGSSRRSWPGRCQGLRP